MFRVHDLIDVVGQPTDTRRVVWVAPRRDALAMLMVRLPKVMPWLVPFDEAEAEVKAGRWTVSAGEPHPFRPDSTLLASAIARRKANWDLLRDIVTEGTPLVFDKMRRAELVMATCRANGKSRNTVKTLLLAYYHGGLTKNALIPNWEACGAPGKTREVTPETRKRGCPRKNGDKPGLNITAELRRTIGLAVSHSFEINKRHSVATSYAHWCSHYLMREVVDENGELQPVLREEYRLTGLPSESQFRYWLGRERDMVAVLKRRLGTRNYEMKHRALLSTSTAEAALGACSRFQIDATILDFYVRSRRSSKQIVGRPTLYVVIDVFSRLIVGIYIGLESPSWVAAMMALANCVADKVKFCKSFGIDIEPGEWPSGICGIVEGDRGEMEKADVVPMLETLSIIVENAAAYRGDWKAIVESRFFMLPAIFKPYVPGYVETDYRERGARDYRADAVLTIDDVTRIVIRLVIFYNNYHELKDYPRHPGLVEDGVPSVPLDLFNWSIANLSGIPRGHGEDVFRFALMPVAKARVTRNGLRFENRYYCCDRGLKEGWFERAEIDGKQERKISHDKRYVDVIYVHDRHAPDGFEVARLLTDLSPDKAGLSSWEAKAIEVDQADRSANRRDTEMVARAKVILETKRIVDGATRRCARVAREPVLAQVKNIRTQRAIEKAADRVLDGVAFAPAAAATADEPPAEPPPRPLPAKPQLSFPSLKRRMNAMVPKQ